MKFNFKLLSALGVSAMMALLVFPMQTSALNLGFKTDIKADKNHVAVEARAQDNDNQDDGDYRNNENLPWGIRHAAGIWKRVQNGKGLPPGIAKLLDGKKDKKDDHGDRSDIKVSDYKVNTSTTSAVISFKSDVETDGVLRYSKNSDLSNDSEVSLSLEKNHSVTLNNLDVDTKYYFEVELENADDDESYESSVKSFKTLKEEVDAAIKIRDFQVERKADGATIRFNTNIMTDGVLVYGTSSDLSTSTEVDLNLANLHIVNLDNLEADTKYYVKVELESEDGDETLESSVRSFTTLKEDEKAPNISFYHIFNVDTDSAYVVWITNEEADGRVWVETDSSVDVSVSATMSESDLSLFHIFHLTGLNDDTTYYVKVGSEDDNGNEKFSDVTSFTTDNE